MAFVETSIGLPMLYGYALQKGAHEGRTRLAYEWEDDVLARMRRMKP
jgi:hypothetical protein